MHGKGGIFDHGLSDVVEVALSRFDHAFDDAFDYGHYDEQFVFVNGVKISNDANYWIEQNLNQNKDE